MRYALFFALALVALTAVVVVTFDRISAPSLATPSPAVSAAADTVTVARVATPLAPSLEDYERYANADSVWRARHARPYSVSELRARGDGKRTARQSMQDRVYASMKRGDRASAIAQLERWVRGHPRDAESLLSLARLLNETGRTDDAIARYRQILALQGRAE